MAQGNGRRDAFQRVQQRLTGYPVVLQGAQAVQQVTAHIGELPGEQQDGADEGGRTLQHVDQKLQKGSVYRDEECEDRREGRAHADRGGHSVPCPSKDPGESPESVDPVTGDIDP